jgi:hypothetical protein
MRLLPQVIRRNSGRIRLGDDDITTIPERAARHAHVDDLPGTAGSA